MICAKSWSYMHQVLYFGMFPYPSLSSLLYLAIMLAASMCSCSVSWWEWAYGSRKKTRKMHYGTQVKKVSDNIGPSLSLALVFSVFLWTWLVTFLILVVPLNSTSQTSMSFSRGIEDVNWDEMLGCKFQIKKGGGECVLIKIKSAKKEKTHIKLKLKTLLLFLYVFVYLAEFMCFCFA